ncbi:MAG: hypothetical protein WCW16_04465 [Candidatus Magasanikbacteria bacterium]
MKRIYFLGLTALLLGIGGNAFAAAVEDSMATCTNGIDDDGDDAIDCDDDDCGDEADETTICGALEKARAEARLAAARVAVPVIDKRTQDEAARKTALELALTIAAARYTVTADYADIDTTFDTIQELVKKAFAGNTKILKQFIDDKALVDGDMVEKATMVYEWAKKFGYKDPTTTVRIAKKAGRKVRRVETATGGTIEATDARPQMVAGVEGAPLLVAVVAGPAVAPAVIDCTQVRALAFKGCAGKVAKVETTVPNYDQCASVIQAYGRTRCAD